MSVTGTTGLVFLLGSPVAQSKSPLMHNAAFEATGEDLVYVAFDVGLGGAADALRGMRALGVRGGNVTMPLKQAVAPLVDRLAPLASLIGAVNTIVNEDGVLVGHNTDGEGYFRGLAEAGIPYVGKKLTIIGAGGAATAIAVQAAAEGVRAVAMFNGRDHFFEQAMRLADELRDRFAFDISVHEREDDAALRREIASSDVLVNATSVGMGPLRGQSIVADATYFHRDLVVTDVVYVPAETKLLELARRAGCRTVSGIGMNIFQAAGAFKLWTHKDMPIDLVKTVVFGGCAIDQ
jgi:shikimate dehydrogenase